MKADGKEMHTVGKPLVVSLAFAVVLVAAPLPAQDDWSFEPFSPNQLDNLLAPIALYPDPLLAQVLVAATFPDQVDEADRFVRSDLDPDDIDDQPWDVSVRAVSHYAAVLQMMADKLDWTTSLGQAYVSQSTDVMASVQRLRARARAAGNLVTTAEMEVVDSDGYIELWPAQPQYLFVPRYDPAVVFFARVPSFLGTRFLIGAWLNYDCNWRAHRVYYHGWEHDRGWRERSRPFIRVTNHYINNNFFSVFVNREIVRRRVNYRELDRYNDAHRGTNFDSFHGHRHDTPPPNREPIRNKILVRNFDADDPRLDEYRGRIRPPAEPVQVRPPGPPVQVPDSPAFDPGQGGFDPRSASRRGQLSRARVRPPQPSPPPLPPARHVERRRP